MEATGVDTKVAPLAAELSEAEEMGLEVTVAEAGAAACPAADVAVRMVAAGLAEEEATAKGRDARVGLSGKGEDQVVAVPAVAARRRRRPLRNSWHLLDGQTIRTEACQAV